MFADAYSDAPPKDGFFVGAMRGQIEFAVRHEKARTLGDILLRRTGLAFERNYEPAWARATAAIAAAALGWSRAETENACAEFQDELGNTLVSDRRLSPPAAGSRLP